jgi:hypothetical protein
MFPGAGVVLEGALVLAIRTLMKILPVPLLGVQLWKRCFASLRVILFLSHILRFHGTIKVAKFGGGGCDYTYIRRT